MLCLASKGSKVAALHHSFRICLARASRTDTCWPAYLYTWPADLLACGSSAVQLYSSTTNSAGMCLVWLTTPC